MVEKEVKKTNPEYHISGSIEKRFRPLFSSAKTRESKDVDALKDFKQIVTKEEKRKLGFAEFDAPKEE